MRWGIGISELHGKVEVQEGRDRAERMGGENWDKTVEGEMQAWVKV